MVPSGTRSASEPGQHYLQNCRSECTLFLFCLCVYPPQMRVFPYETQTQKNVVFVQNQGAAGLLWHPLVGLIERPVLVRHQSLADVGRLGQDRAAGSRKGKSICGFVFYVGAARPTEMELEELWHLLPRCEK